MNNFYNLTTTMMILRQNSAIDRVNIFTVSKAVQDSLTWGELFLLLLILNWSQLHFRNISRHQIFSRKDTL